MVYEKRKFSPLLLTFVFLFFVSVPVKSQVKSQTAIVKKPVKKMSAVSYTDRAARFEKAGKYEKAIADLKRALLLSPQNPAIYNNLGAVYTKQKRFEDALESLGKAVTLDPGLARSHYNISIVYDHLKRPLDALAAARRAVAINPEYINARVQMCELSLVVKQNNEAVACYKSLQKFKNLDGRAMTYYGMALLRTEKTKQAISILEEAVRLMPDNPLPNNLLGKALYEKKQYKEAIKIFNHALRQNPGTAELRFNLAIAQLTSGNRDAAIVHYKVLKNSNPPLAQKLYRAIYAGDVVFIEN